MSQIRSAKCGRRKETFNVFDSYGVIGRETQAFSESNIAGILR